MDNTHGNTPEQGNSKEQQSTAPILKTRALVLNKFSFFLSVIALILGIIVLWQVHKISNHYSTTSDQLSNAAAMIAQQQQSLDNLTKTQTQQTKQLETFDEHLKNIDDTISTLSQQKLHSDDTLWQLNRAYYLLQIAQFNLQWNRDVANSQLLLSQADAIIRELALPDSLGIRQALANEMTQLATVAIIDKAGILAQLAAISEQIPQLPLLHENYFLPKENSQTTNTSSSNSWKNALNQSLQTLQKIVIIRHHENQVSPLPSPEMRRLLDDRIKILLQQTQDALLHANSEIYKLSLQQAIETIKNNFNSDNLKTHAVVKQLTALQQLNIAPSLPDITNSQLKLKQYLSKQHLNAVKKDKP